jgi:hypothetical protein
MRHLCLAVLSLAVASPAFAGDCTKDVAAAFTKQHNAKAFRVDFDQPTAQGAVHVRVDYMPPDRMLQTVSSPIMPAPQQIMLVGNRAFSGTAGSFEELQPQFVQSIAVEVKSALALPSANLGLFECVGNAKLDDRDLVAYRIGPKDKAALEPAKRVARTIYVDPKSGLPAFNVISSEAEGGKPILKVAYSYPADIDIVAPADAPVQKPQ